LVQALTTRSLQLLCCLLLAGCASAPAIDTRYSALSQDSRAWHAGASYWQGHTFLNASSIGIEIVNDGDSGAGGVNFAPYPQAQIDAVVALVRDVAARHGVKPHRIVGHSDIQPQTKRDPGPLFPWHSTASTCRRAASSTLPRGPS
jgi:N-acetyl-anhydromuramyl-L-alanine amidase AmpD